MIHLRRAEELALQTQNRAVACWAVLEQCYAEALAGRRPDAARLSERAFGLADDDPGRLAAAHAFAGFNLADWGRYVEADRAYDMSLALARKSGAAKREGWALGLGAWSKLRGDNTASAVNWAREAIELCNRLDWLSFRPWPEAVLAEAEFAAGGDPASIRDRLQATLAMACQLSDPCWQAATCRVIALCHQREGASRIALGWLNRAAQAFAKVTDPYAALLLRIQFDRARFTLETDPKGGQTLVRELLVSAARFHADGELDAALALRSGVPRG